jgi:hypothetical protein
VNPYLIAYLVVLAVAIIDIWTSRLSFGARVLWTLAVVFLSVVGLASWAITRGSAHRPVETF